MEGSAPDIVLLERRIDPAELRRLGERFEGMVKYVVDVERALVALGGELHADAEEVLLEAGSRQIDLWGANYYPGRGAEDCIEYTSLINIRPAAGNQGMELQDATLREKVREITHALVGQGEAV